MFCFQDQVLLVTLCQLLPFLEHFQPQSGAEIHASKLPLPKKSIFFCKTYLFGLWKSIYQTYIKAGLHERNILQTIYCRILSEYCLQYIANNCFTICDSICFSFGAIWLARFEFESNIVEYCGRNIKLVWYFSLKIPLQCYNIWYCDILLAIYCERSFTQQMILWTISTIYCPQYIVPM